MASVFKLAICTLRMSLFCQMLSARLLVTYVLFWYSIPFTVFASNYNPTKSKHSQINNYLNFTNFSVRKETHTDSATDQNNPTDELGGGRGGTSPSHINEALGMRNPELLNLLDDKNSTHRPAVRRFPPDVLFNLKPNFAGKFEDPSPSKCYILSVSGGGAKGSFSSGLLNGLAFIYRYHGIKLRWDVTSGVSIGSLITLWSQLYHPGQSTHFSSEGASLWRSFTHKNVHNCKSTMAQNAPIFIFRAITQGRKLPNYLCSTYPMLVYMRHLIQNRRRFKGTKWSALAYHSKFALPYYFNEEMPRSLIPSVIRSSSSFPIVLEPTEISGIGKFGDGALSKTLDLQNSIYRCLQSGKARSDKDVVIDIITTSYTDHEFYPVHDLEHATTMFESLSWFLNFYTFTRTYQQYEIIQAIRRYPNIQFRHFLSYMDKEDSIINKMGLFDFKNSIVRRALGDGVESGFYNSTVFRDVWKPVDRDISPSRDWKPYGGDHLVVPKSTPQVSNPDTDVFVEFPTLENVPYSPSPILEFVSLATRASPLPDGKTPGELLDHDTLTFFLELHRHIFSMRFLENVREFTRERDDDLLYINEEQTHLDRVKRHLRMTTNGAPPTSKSKLEPQNSQDGPPPSWKEAPDVSKSFFRASRGILNSVSSSFAYSETVKSRFLKSHTKFKHKKLLKKERKIRRALGTAFEEFSEKKHELERLYEEYDSVMEPLNRVYSNMLRLTGNCESDARKVPLMLPFLEGEDSKNLIWAPSEEYDSLSVEFKKSTLELLSEMHPSVDWFSRLPPRLGERPSRTRSWDQYKKKLLSHLRYDRDDKIMCWASHPDLKKIVSELRDLTRDISSLKVRHYNLMTRITNIQLVISKYGVVSRHYSATLEILFRKNFLENLQEVEDIFHKTSHSGYEPELSSDHLSGLTSERELQIIKDEVLSNIQSRELPIGASSI